MKLLLILLSIFALGAIPTPNCTDYTTAMPSVTPVTGVDTAIPDYPCGGAPLEKYVDSSVVSSGDGTELSPYKLFSDLDATFWNEVAASITANKKVKIKLKRGKTWTEQLTIGAEGTSTLVNIKVEPYGTGALPIIDCDGVADFGVLIDGKDYVTINGTRIINCVVAGVELEGESTGISVTDCEIEDGAKDGIHAQADAQITPITNLTISGNNIDNNGEDGIQIAFVEDSLITSNTLGNLGGFINLRFNVTINSSIGNIIEKNLCNKSGASGIHIGGATSVSNIIRYNYCIDSNNTAGANYGGISTVSDGGSNEIYGNIIYTTNRGVVLRGSPSGVVYNNTFYDITNQTIFTNLSTANITIKNNLTWHNQNLEWVSLETGSTTDVVVNNNLYWTTNTLPEGDRWRSGTLKNWSEWQALPQDASGDVGDPRFEDAPTDFWVGVGSAAIGLAADLSAEDPNYDNRIVQGSTFGVGSDLTVTSDKTTAGAYEYIIP